MTATQPNYLSISRRALDLEDYLDIARRHIGWILGPIYAGLVLTVVIAYLLPDVYESKATMQITPAQISDALVPSALNQQLFERVLQMQGQIESRTSLSNLIQSPNLDLYAAERKKKPIDDVIEDMKRQLRISINQLPTVSAAKHASTFDIIFRYPNRTKAQATVQYLITRFQEENQTGQQNQQKVLKDMVGDDVTSTRASVQKVSEALTKFRIENQGKLPEQTQINVAALTAAQQQFSAVQENINRLDQNRTQLEAGLQVVKNQMQMAQSLAIEAPAADSPIRRQNEELTGLNREIESGELRLQQLLQSFTEAYPDVQNIRKNLKVLKVRRDQLADEQQKQIAAEEAAIADKDSQKKMSPQMMQAMQKYQEQIRAGEVQLLNNTKDREFRVNEMNRLNKEIQVYRDRLAPSGIEAQLADLLREQKAATDAYESAVARQRVANQNGELVQRRAGELLEVLDPPSLPINHATPNRGMIIGGGLGVSLILGLALAAVQEVKDTSLKNLKDVRAYTNLPVLGSIPLLENTILVKRKRRVTYLGWSAAVIVGILAVCASLFYYYTVTVNT